VSRFSVNSNYDIRNSTNIKCGDVSFIFHVYQYNTQLEPKTKGDNKRYKIGRKKKKGYMTLGYKHNISTMSGNI
jgi:hypothetical protein